MCGGIAGFRCQEKLFCTFSTRCGSADIPGTCQSKPEVCSELFAPVCGCDGKTYPNACHAQRAGMSIAATGACKP